MSDNTESPDEPDDESRDVGGDGNEDGDDGGSHDVGVRAVAPESSSPPVALTGWQRLQQTFVNPTQSKSSSPAPDFSSMTDAEVRAQITKIDAIERRVGMAASVLAAAFALIFTLPYMVSKIAVPGPTKPVHKKCPDHFTFTTNGSHAASCNKVYPPSHYLLPLIVWLALAVAIYVTVRIGRRSLVAFTILITGLSFGTFLVFLPFLVAGGWLLLRAYRTQRYGSPTAKEPVEGYAPRGSRKQGGSRAGPSLGPSSGAKSSAKSGPSPARPKPKGDTGPPSANKRYPPKTTQKRCLSTIW